MPSAGVARTAALVVWKTIAARYDVMDPGLLADIGDVCGLLALGLESASMDTLKRMNKVKDADHFRGYLAGAEALFQQAAAHEIPLALFVIIGFGASGLRL